MNKLNVSFFLILSALVLFLTINRHIKSKYNDYHSVLWGDKAGYNVYLPAMFLYGFDANQFPDSIEAQSGNGFRLDKLTGKIATKYTYGVGLLQMPFFLIAHGITKITKWDDNGYSPPYHWAVNFASVFYLITGFIFLFNFLSFYFAQKNSYLILLSLLFGTNLYYYGIDETGMSHIYSFFLFSLLLYFIKKMQTNASRLSIAVIGFAITTIILIRPLNLFFVVCVFFLDSSLKDIPVIRLKPFLKKMNLLILMLVSGCIAAPQLIYWSYLSGGSLFFYSYENENFSNWLKPKLFEIWISPTNSLLAYSPLYFIIIGTIVYQAWKQHKNGILILVIFLGISYFTASWWDWNFGCAFGSRNFVEYTSIFALPLGVFFQKISNTNLKIRLPLIFIILLMVTFNMKMAYSYDGCFYGNEQWDWITYFELVASPTK